MIIIFSGFLLRIILQIYNIEIAWLPGGEADAGWFHREAVEYSKYIAQKEFFPDFTWTYKIGWNYAVLLGYLLNFFGTESHYFTGFLSCFVWFLSAIVFRNIMFKLKFEKRNINYAILFYTFLFPSSAIFTALTLREVYMLLFFNVFTLSLINIYYEKEIKKIFFNIIFILIASFLLVTFHKGNGYLLIILFPLLIIYKFINKFNISKFTLITLVILIVSFLSYHGYTELLFDDIKDYQMGHFYPTEDRAAYYSRNEINTMQYDIITLIMYIGKNLYHYLLSPTIFQVSNIKDIAVFCENTIRLLLIFFSLKKVTLQFDKKNIFIILLTIFLIMETIYAQGTVNWGTATRHHVPVMGILILLSFFPTRKTK